MATNKSIFNNGGKKVMLNRYAKVTPDYTPPTKIKVGINTATTINVTDTDLQNAIPIQNGTVNDNGEQTFTGSAGGDNSTDNTVTYKDGAGETDATAQNLIANDTDVTKTWTIAALTTSITSGQFTGLWVYIKDQTALDKIVDLEITLSTFITTYLNASLSVGWNWLDLGSATVVSSSLVIEIETNLLTDTFVAGDIVYDLLRQWEEADLYQTFDSGYPVIDEINNEITTRVTLTVNQASGFSHDSTATFNNDATEILVGESSFDEDGKSADDEFVYIIKERFN
jgi:hypothetical protein